MDKIEQIALEVSDPESTRYGQHLSAENVRDLVSNPIGSNAVMDFLAKSDVEIIRRSEMGDYIKAEAPISTWEAMFSTTFFTFDRHNTDGSFTSFVRSHEYTLPAEISEHVSLVLNTVQMPLRVRHPHRSDAPALASGPAPIVTGSVTPALLNKYYNVASNGGKNLGSQSVYETINQDYSPDDLSLFQKNFGLPVEAIAQDIGGFNLSTTCTKSPDDCGEANLDVQYLMAVAQEVPTIYYYEDSSDDTFLLLWIADLGSMKSPPLVNSISYGSEESELTASYVAQFDKGAAILASRGITVTVSSGDDGAGGTNVRSGSKYCSYSPEWPTSSPYVLSVGATQGPESNSAEVVCSSKTGGVISSGGGFSNFYTQPSWQTDAVNGYLSYIAKNPASAPSAGYTKTGRAYPDISVLGYNYYLTLGGKWVQESGTVS